MSNWFEKLLTPIDSQPHEDVSVKEIMDSLSVVGSNNNGTFRNSYDEPIGIVEEDIDHTNMDFTLVYRIRVPAESWNSTDIVCDGNAMDVTTSPLPDGRYKVKRTLRGYKPTTIVEESEISLQEHASTKDFVNWIETQDLDTIEALRQIYYDRWCFDTANQKDRMYYEILEEEKQGKV